MYATQDKELKNAAQDKELKNAAQDKELKNAAQDKQLKYTERMTQNQGKTVVPMCVKRSPREGAVPQFCAVP
jgi:hypothetical protein